MFTTIPPIVGTIAVSMFGGMLTYWSEPGASFDQGDISIVVETPFNV